MITSLQNPLIKEVRRLRKERRTRDAAGLFIVEGIQGVVEAIDQQAGVQTVLLAPERLNSARAQAAVTTVQGRGVRVEEVSADVFAALSERENPVGILAVVEQRFVELETLTVTAETLLVGLHGISDPGNLGTILRTVDAVGGQGVVLIGNTVEPYHPSAVKASAGTIFTVPMVRVSEIDDFIGWCRRAGVGLVATSDRGQHSHWEADYPSPLALLMGSEAHGLPEEVLAVTDSVRIPMWGAADSLNLALATGLVLYEVRRRTLT